MVSEQIDPNPDFPTVSFPNPEETGALDLAMQTADREGKTLVIAHDPDADRFAAAEKAKYLAPFFLLLLFGYMLICAAARGSCLQETTSEFCWHLTYWIRILFSQTVHGMLC